MATKSCDSAPHQSPHAPKLKKGYQPSIKCCPSAVEHLWHFTFFFYANIKRCRDSSQALNLISNPYTYSLTWDRHFHYSCLLLIATNLWLHPFGCTDPFPAWHPCPMATSNVLHGVWVPALRIVKQRKAEIQERLSQFPRTININRFIALYLHSTNAQFLDTTSSIILTIVCTFSGGCFPEVKALFCFNLSLLANQQEPQVSRHKNWNRAKCPFYMITFSSTPILASSRSLAHVLPFFTEIVMTWNERG